MRARALSGALSIVVSLLGAHCSRRAEPSLASAGPVPPGRDPDGAAPPVAPRLSVAPPPDASAFTAPLVLAAGEAQRMTIARFEADPLLRAQAAPLREHFGERARGPFHLQRIELATGATALLVARADDSDPFVLVVDRDRLEWSKPRPTAGMVTPAQELTISPRPDGGVVEFVWVAALQTVAARAWADDGNAFGDFEIFKPDACDALSAAYAPGGGWIVACSSSSGARLERWREDGTNAWGSDGVALGASGATGPVTIAIDSPSSFVLLQRVAAVGGSRLMASRYDPSAQPLWGSPADVGVAPGPASARFEASVVRGGVVHVDWPRGAGPARAAEIAPDGHVEFRERR